MLLRSYVRREPSLLFSFSSVSSWVLYEKPNFKGEKIALDEGDIEITCPFSPPEHQQNGYEEGAQKGPGEQSKPESARKFIIGSIRRAVRVRQPQLSGW